MKNMKYFIIHCTATPEGREVTSGEIQRWHKGPKDLPGGKVLYMGKEYDSRNALPNDIIAGMSVKLIKGRGWRQIGYTDIIHLDGTVENMIPNNDNNIVDPWEVSNGAAGVNSVSRHIVYAGGTDKAGKSKDTRNEKQKIALREKCMSIIAQNFYVKIIGHNQVNQTECPGFDVAEWLKEIGINERNIHVGKI
jgi:N-acetylmuramoyl-L-alanine amidase